MPSCWKCGDVEKCNCDLLASTKESIDRAIARTDAMGSSLDDFRKRLEEHRKKNPLPPIDYSLAEDRDISRMIHFLCLMADELEEKLAAETVIRPLDKKELSEKALFIAELSNRLK